VRHFADEQVGSAGGGKYIKIPEGADEVKGEATYADIVNKLKQLESDVGGMSGGLGSLMAMRRNLFQPYRPGSINDDTVPSILCIYAGKRNVWDSDAKAYEESGFGMGDEFRRRIRIGAGNFQTLFRYPGILLPKYGMAFYTFFSHKVIRWIFPFLMIGALITNLFLLKHSLYQLAFGGQIVFYLGAVIGGLALVDKIRLPIVTGLFHFVAMNAGLLLGFFVYLKGIRSSAWDRTERAATLDSPAPSLCPWLQHCCCPQRFHLFLAARHWAFYCFCLWVSFLILSAKHRSCLPLPAEAPNRSNLNNI
jgi:cellulose synthase/poly-beta-1,6-N-acetylglucosamine synthase-like glycosyltransferase